MKEITINGETYDIATRQATGIVNAIMRAWQALGRPSDPLSTQGQKLMSVIIATWEDTYPYESREWYEMRKEYQLNELDVRTQVKKQTGGSLVSYPYYIYTIMKKVFPAIKLHDRTFCQRLVKVFPMFRMSEVRS